MTQISPWTIANYPAAIFQEIVAQLLDDIPTLKSVCLTASSFREMTQKAIFRKTNISGRHSGDFNTSKAIWQSARIKQLYDIIQSREDLASLVKTLHFDLGPQTLTSPEAVEHASYLISKFGRVEQVTLSINNADPTPNDLAPTFLPGSPLRNAILKFLQTQSLTTVIFDDFCYLSPSHLLHLGPSVRHLGLVNATFFPYNEVACFRIDSPDILESYDLKPGGKSPVGKVLIKSLDLDLNTSSGILFVLDRMLDSPHCGLDLSRVTQFSVRSERSLKEYLDALGLIYGRIKESLTELDTFNGHGFLFPESLSLQSFPKLQTFRAFLGLHENGKPELDRFLGFLEDGRTALSPPGALRQINLTILVRYDAFVPEVENATWNRVAEVFNGKEFEGLEKVELVVMHASLKGLSQTVWELMDKIDEWGLGYRGAMKELNDRGILDVTIAPINFG